MNILSAIGAALLFSVLLFSLKALKSPLAPFVLAGGGLVLFLSFLPVLGEIRAAVEGLLPTGVESDHLSLALRGVGIAWLSEVAAGLCRDLGEGAVADRLLLLSRGAILLLSLPTVVEILTLAVEYASF